MAPIQAPIIPRPGITCAQILRFCGRDPKPEERFGFDSQARRFRYKYNENPAPNTYRTDEPAFPGRRCCASFSEAGYGSLAARARRMPPIRCEYDASPASVNVQWDRHQRADWSVADVSRPFTGPEARGNEWTKKAWIPSPDAYHVERCTLQKLNIPPIKFQFNSRALRDGDLPRLLRNARYPGPNYYHLPPAERNKLPRCAQSDFKKGYRRTVWLDDAYRRGRTLPAPNQYSRCHSESTLLGGGRSIQPEHCEPLPVVTPGPGQYDPAAPPAIGDAASFNARPPAFLAGGRQIGGWTSPRGRPPPPGTYDVPRLFGNAETVFNWAERLKWI